MTPETKAHSLLAADELAELLYEHDPMCGMASCEITARKLSPILLDNLTKAIAEERAAAFREAAWICGQRADDYAHGAEPEYADHRAEQYGREAEARYLARTIRALAIEQSQHHGGSHD